MFRGLFFSGHGVVSTALLTWSYQFWRDDPLLVRRHDSKIHWQRCTSLKSSVIAVLWDSLESMFISPSDRWRQQSS